MKDYTIKVSEMRKACDKDRLHEYSLEAGVRNYRWLEDEVRRGADVCQWNGAVIKGKKDKNGRIIKFIVAGYRPDGSDSLQVWQHFVKE